MQAKCCEEPGIYVMLPLLVRVSALTLIIVKTVQQHCTAMKQVQANGWGRGERGI